MIEGMKIVVVALLLAGALAVIAAADPPQASISNNQIKAQLYLPDAKSGYYRGTRFDWSGVIFSFIYQGHNYYGPWYQGRRDDVRDFVYEGPNIVAGPCSAITGPVEEYAPIGYDEAQPGGSFIKIGIGVLRKPDAKPYDHYRLYEVIDAGKWTIHRASDHIEFIQEIKAPGGYAYVYRKTVRLVKGKPQMLLEHRLKNTGTSAITTNVYNHNFLVLDEKAPGPGYSITFPFDIQSNRPIRSGLAEIKGKEIVYLKTLQGKDTVATPIQGFSDSPKDYDFHIENTAAGAGMKVTGDRPISQAALWSIRSVVAVEPYINVSVEPGKESAWTFTYDYYTLGAAK
jgi:hypothetical protein